MIKAGITIDAEDNIEEILNYAKVIDKKLYQVYLFCDKALSVDYSCFPTSEILFFDGMLLSFNADVLHRNLHSKKIKKMIWMPRIKDYKVNEILDVMAIRNDDRLRIVLDATSSNDKELDYKKIYAKTMIEPHKTLNKIEDINKAIGELYEH